MGQVRRNAITFNDAIAVAVIAAVSGVAATFAGCRPTGEPVVDAVLCAAFAAFVTWLGASAPWWALLAAAGIATAGTLGGSLVLLVLTLVALLAAAWIGSERANQPAVRAGIAGLVVQVTFRFEFDPFFLASAIVAAIALVLLIATGWQRRQKYVRRRILWSTVALAVVAVVAVAGFGVSAVQHRDSFTSGYRSMLNGLDFMQAGNVEGARAALIDAADELGAASEGFGGSLGQPARLVPGIAQNRAAAVDVLASGADAATSAAQALAFVDLDRLTVRDGVVDVVALAALAQPFEELENAVLELSDALRESDSDWLAPPVRSRLDTSRQRADQLVPQSIALASAARTAPAMLGADETRRYFLAFVNPAESRAHSGLMGNWSELTVRNGRLSVTRNGRTAELQRTLREQDVFVNQTPEFYERLGPVGAGNPPTVPAQPNLWVNVLSSPDMATVGDVMARLYEANAGYPVDGVFVIDPAGIAALLTVAGAIEIEIDGAPQVLTGDTVEQFLLFDQYELDEGDRERILEAITDAAVDRLLTSTLPAPQRLAIEMSDAVLHGHISGWASRLPEQRLFRQVGMDALLPAVGSDGWSSDALAVVSDNGSQNKIDSFLQRDVEYLVEVDADSGELEAVVRVRLTNDAPASGLEDYVIGNAWNLPTGTNRSVLTIYTPHELVEVTIDGNEVTPFVHTELGWNTHQLITTLAPEGGTALIEARLRGAVTPGTYALLIRPQPLPNSDTLRIEVEERGGATVLTHEGPIARRSVLDSTGIRAWR